MDILRDEDCDDYDPLAQLRASSYVSSNMSDEEQAKLRGETLVSVEDDLVPVEDAWWKITTMTVTLGRLLEESLKLAVAPSDDSVGSVLERMLEHDHSQLPVVVVDGPDYRAISRGTSRVEGSCGAAHVPARTAWREQVEVTHILSKKLGERS